MAGILISFDGLDSSGKATQAGVLFSHLEHRGALVKKFESPDYTTPSGKELKLRLQGKLGDWANTPWQEKMQYFAQNRTEHKAEVLDILDKDGIVIYDRYVPSSIAFMVEEAHATGEDRKKIHEVVRELECGINGMPREHMSLFFDIPPRIACDLLEGRKAKAGEEDEFTDHISVQEALYEEYKIMCQEYPDTMMHVVCVDGGKLRTIDDIAKEVRTKLAQTFPEHVQLFS
jgi:dTMP kinase